MQSKNLDLIILVTLSSNTFQCHSPLVVAKSILVLPRVLNQHGGILMSDLEWRRFLKMDWS